jgi:hypothetical protein
VVNTILPTGDLKIQDGQFTSNAENYKEFWYTMVGLAGESQNFDGNGQYVRFAVGGGDQTISTGKYGGNAGQELYANVNDAPLGTRPLYPGKRPAYRPDAPCKDQQLPNLDAAKSGPPDGGSMSAASVGSRLSRQNAGLAAKTRKAGAKKDLTAEIVDRLNPFRGTGAKPRKATGAKP